MAFVRAIEIWTNFLARLGALLLLPLVGAMMYEVASRYLLGAPTFWAFELAYMMMGTIFMFGIAYAMRRRAHVNVDLIYGQLGTRFRGIIDLLGYAMLLPCVTWLTWALFWYAIRAWEGHELSGQSAWNPVIWPYRVMYVIGFATFLLQILAEVVKSLHAAIRNEPFPEHV